MPKQPMDRQRSKKQRVRKTMRLVSDYDLVQRYNDMKTQAVKRGNLWTDEEEDELKKVEAEYLAASTEYVLVSIGSKKYDELLKDNRPTKAQVDAAKADGGDTSWNPETFPPLLVWHSLGGEDYCPWPEFKEEWEEDLSNGDTMALFSGAMEVNMGFVLADLGNSSRRTRR